MRLDPKRMLDVFGIGLSVETKLLRQQKPPAPFTSQTNWCSRVGRHSRPLSLVLVQIQDEAW